MCTGNNTRVYIIIVLLIFWQWGNNLSSIFKNICVFQLHFRWQETHNHSNRHQHSIFHLFHKMCVIKSQKYIWIHVYAFLTFPFVSWNTSTGKTGHILDIQIRNNLNEMASLFYKISLIKRKKSHLIQKRRS